jgi:hypothetical protein
MLKLIEQMNRDMDRMREINHEVDGLLTTDDVKTDAYFRYQFIQKLKDQVKLKEKETIATTDRIFEKQDEIREGQKKVTEMTKDLQKREKTQKILGWIDIAATAVTVTVGIASATLFVASFFTAGATAPLAMGLLGAAGGIGSLIKGGVTIEKAVLSHKSKKQQAELLEISENREAANSTIEQCMNEWRQDMQSITNSWSVLKQYIDKRNETFSLIK